MVLVPPSIKVMQTVWSTLMYLEWMNLPLSNDYQTIYMLVNSSIAHAFNCYICSKKLYEVIDLA